MEKTKQRLAGDTHSGAGLLRRMAAAGVRGSAGHRAVAAQRGKCGNHPACAGDRRDPRHIGHHAGGHTGYVYQQISEALELINSYRKEACDNGYPNPSTGAALTSRTMPIQWSDDLEYIARIRAAESSQTMGHVRTNGNSCFNIYSPNGMRSFGECLAWNYSKNVLDGIERGIEEKSDYLNNTGGVTGHYTSMIDRKTPGRHRHILSKLARYPNTTCAEYNSVGSGNSWTSPMGTVCRRSR
ncbi:MAG: CAP domain-containing protein [Ruminococcus callidus]